MNTLNKRMLNDYWFATGTPTYLVHLLSPCKENLNELTGKYYLPSSFMVYVPYMKSVLPLFYQNGYLTIKDWNMDFDSYLLDFPNEEVKQGIASFT